MEFAVIVPWFDPEQIRKFLDAWGLPRSDKEGEQRPLPPWLILQQDANKEGCGATKNRGIRKAMGMGAEVVVILDDDCYPDKTPSARDVSSHEYPQTLWDLAQAHIQCLKPQQAPVLQILTRPAARGNPYFNRTIQMPVAASIGWWSEIPDRDAVRQLADGAFTRMDHDEEIVYGRAVMSCGMNIAFRPSEWWPWCSFVETSRFDDVFMSWLWSKEAMRRSHCFNFRGPTVRHSRQSKVFASLRDEAKWMEFNETIWSDIWMSPETDYDKLRAMVPVERVPV